MILHPSLYESPKSRPEARRAIIVLPEIFGLNAFVQSVADHLAESCGALGFGLDHFFAANGQKNVIGYSDHQRGVELMGRVTGEKYVSLLKLGIDSIMTAYPQVDDIVVVGFCFGGKLAYLSGVDPRVQTIVSFYGGTSLAPDFYDNDSSIEALCKVRREDAKLRVLGIFGEQDDLIPDSDRDDIKDLLESAGISVRIKTYPAGHAFFNHDRSDRYDEPAAQAAWADVVDFLG